MRYRDEIDGRWKPPATVLDIVLLKAITVPAKSADLGADARESRIDLFRLLLTRIGLFAMGE